MSDRAEDDAPERPSVAWNDIVRFIRQLSHDLRNHLNAAELQSAYIDELGQDPELKAEIKRLRETISTLATVLQKLSSAVATPKLELMPYRASDFIEDLRNQLTRDFPQESARITWDAQVDESTSMSILNCSCRHLLKFSGMHFNTSSARGRLRRRRRSTMAGWHLQFPNRKNASTWPRKAGAWSRCGALAAAIMALD
jgi:hypothetical protein